MRHHISLGLDDLPTVVALAEELNYHCAAHRVGRTKSGVLARFVFGQIALILALRFVLPDFNILLAGNDRAAVLRLAIGSADLYQFRLGGNCLLYVLLKLRLEAFWIATLCGIWANCKSVLLARSPPRRRRGSRHGRCITFRTGKKSLQAPLAGTYSVYHAYPSGMGRLCNALNETTHPAER